jgi:hypothetical protein
MKISVFYIAICIFTFAALPAVFSQSNLFDDETPQENLPLDEVELDSEKTDSPVKETSDRPVAEETESSPSAPEEQIPNNFQGIQLGMELDTVKDNLVNSPYFRYRGDPDVSLLLTESRSIIESSGYSYIERGLFQFYNDQLYIITIILNQNELDFFSMYRSLNKKYGDPDVLNPEQISWSFGSVRLSLEKPLTIKYIDTDVLDILKGGSDQTTDLRKLNREQFIGEF